MHPVQLEINQSQIRPDLRMPVVEHIGFVEALFGAKQVILLEIQLTEAKPNVRRLMILASGQEEFSRFLIVAQFG